MNRRNVLTSAAAAAVACVPFAACAHDGGKDDRLGLGQRRRPRTPFRTPIEAPTLDYDRSALVPVLSAETVDFHYGKHHIGYYTNLKGMLKPEELANLTLEDLILRNGPGRHEAPSALYNNAAQIWNHNFYWDSLRANGGGKPGVAMSEAIGRSFGSFEAFREKFTAASVSQFGSGWVWLMRDRRSGQLSILTTSNAICPIDEPSLVPLLVVDVWEHAYYIDYRSKRLDYAKAVFDKLLNWGFAEANMSL